MNSQPYRGLPAAPEVARMRETRSYCEEEHDGPSQTAYKHHLGLHHSARTHCHQAGHARNNHLTERKSSAHYPLRPRTYIRALVARIRADAKGTDGTSRPVATRVRSQDSDQLAAGER